MNKYERIIQTYRCSNNFKDGINAALHYLNYFPKSTTIMENLAIMYYYFDHTTHDEYVQNLQRGLSLLTDIEHLSSDENVLKRTIENKIFFLRKIAASRHGAFGAAKNRSPCDSLPRSAPCREAVENSSENSFSENETSISFEKIKIMFSITSCKRLDLFIRTMDAFLANCQDKHLIDEWVCVDDNSSKEDRAIMMEKYPFFKFVFKTEGERGHPTSMKIITDNVMNGNVTYLVHIEDDREMLYPRTYLTDMIQIIESSDDIGQVAFNHNYAETLYNDIKGGILKKTNGLFYYEHEYCPTAEEKNAFFTKYGPCSSCNYYPHFTLSPSMIKASIFNIIAFENEASFEFRFASRYIAQGFKTVFLPGFHIEHIGRLTSELYDITKLNAYDLNCDLKIGQFNEKIRFKSFLINLDRRDDRMRKIDAQKHMLPSFERFSACDGRGLKISKRLRSLCRYGDYNMRPGVIACALSHLKLYIKLIEDKECDGYLIFEDDVVVDEHFLHKLNRVFAIFETKHIIPPILFLTTSFVKNYIPQTNAEIVKKKYIEMTKISIGGLGCYFISKEVAQKVIDEIEKNTIKYAIDAILHRLGDVVDVYFVLPPICTSPAIDTDIQHDFYDKSPLLENDLKDDDYSPYKLYGEDGKIDIFDNL